MVEAGKTMEPVESLKYVEITSTISYGHFQV